MADSVIHSAQFHSIKYNSVFGPLPQETEVAENASQSLRQGNSEEQTRQSALMARKRLISAKTSDRLTFSRAERSFARLLNDQWGESARGKVLLLCLYRQLANVKNPFYSLEKIMWDYVVTRCGIEPRSKSQFVGKLQRSA